MALNIHEWAARRTGTRPEDASVVVFGMPEPNTINVLICYARTEDDSHSKVVWAAPLAIKATDEGVAIPTPMADVVQNTIFAAKNPGELWAEMPLRLWQTMAGSAATAAAPTAVVGRVLKHAAIDLAFADISGFIESRADRLPDVDDSIAGVVDLAIRNLVDTDTGEQTTLDALAEHFFDRPPRGHDHFGTENLGRLAAKAGETLFMESDPETVEALLAPIFRLGFHLHQDPYEPFPWTLVRNGVNADAVIHRVPDTSTLFAYLFPTCPKPPLVCADVLSMEVQDTTQGEPAAICLASYIARLQDGCETEGA